MTDLRELAAELADVGMCDDDYQLGRGEAGQEIAKRILQILDADGDAGAVGYFAADPAEGDFRTSKTLDEARADAASMLVFAQDAAHEDGWVDEPPQICYGVVLGGCIEKEGSRHPAPEGSDFSEMIDFRLTEPAFTHPQPVRSGVVSDEQVREIVEKYIGKTNSVSKYIADDLRAAINQGQSNG